jgi:hypothetical protein
MKKVAFKTINIGEHFKEREDRPWHLKTSKDKGRFLQHGVDSSPIFEPDEKVFVED